MARNALTLTALVAAGLLMAGGARAEERAEQVVRDAGGLAAVKRIALLPVVTQVRFDQGRTLPDPNRVAARVAAAERLPAILEDQLKDSPYKLLMPEAAVVAVKEQGWRAADLYLTKAESSWDRPAEIMSNKKGDEAALLVDRETMKRAQDEMTQYRFHWHDAPELNIGLASFRMAALARPDVEKAKALAARLNADAVLLCQVAEVETHEGTAGLLSQKFKSTRVHVHCTLVAAADGAILWQARARGVASQQTGIFTGARAYKAEDRKAVECAVQAVRVLVSDLLSGTGEVVKR